MSELTDDLARVRELVARADKNCAAAALAFVSKHAAAIEAMERDAARLDWLMQQMRCEDFCRITGRAQGDPDYARTAIDAAMEAGR